MDQSRFFHGTVDDVHRSLHVPLLVRVLDAEDEIPALMLGDQICVKRGP